MLNLKVCLGAEAWPSLIFGNNFNLINGTFSRYYKRFPNILLFTYSSLVNDLVRNLK